MLQKLDYKRDANYIDGQWVQAESGRAIEVTDPATGKPIGVVPHCGRAEAARAIDAAARALPAWRAKTGAERAAILGRIAELIRANAEELAQILTAEQGKPLAESRGEVGMSAAYVQWFAEEARRIYGDTIPSPWADRRIVVVKEPVGVVAAITPWNFPSSMIARKLGAALAAGCTIVFKPAELTPYSGLAWGVLCEKAGVPAGVANFITGTPADIGAEFTSNPAVRKITFTGSTAVGKLLMKQSADTMKRVSLELGGHAPFIVFDDADLDLAVEQAIASKFRNTGQTCVCTNRFIVQDGIYDAFAQKFAAAVGALKVGAGTEQGVAQGPLISEAALAKVERHVDDATRNGARVLSGGKRHALGRTFYEPTVIADVSRNMLIASEETFGPVAPLFRFKAEAEAIALANDTPYGLAGYFFTRDLARAFRVAEALEYGQVGINAGVITSEVAPFGGVKESGVGREGSKYGIDEYLSVKYLCFGGIR